MASAAGINFTGFNGIDFNAIVDAMMAQESLPLNSLQKQQKSAQSKDAALATLGTQIGSMQSNAKDLASASVFEDVTAASSDTSILTTSLGSGAVAGHYDVVISQLAKAQVTTSTNGFAATSTVVANGGSISFTIDGETSDAINITEDTTLSELRTLINDQQSGVIASIVNTGSTNKLVISSRTTGTDAGFTINNSLTYDDGDVVAFAGNTQNAQNAALTVNGLAITSATNTIPSAVNGVSFTMTKTGSASIDVNASYDDLKSTLTTLVANYNKLRDFYTKQSTPDSDGNRGPMANDSVMRQALRDVRDALVGANSNGGRYHYLSEIGIELTTTGTMTLNQSKLNSAIAEYPSDLAKLFQGSTGDGVFDTLKTKLDKLDATAGLVKVTRSSMDLTLKRFQNRIDDQQLRLQIRRQELQKMYAAADRTMSRLSQLTGSIQSIATRQF